jgi:hypothetical protein
MINPNTSLITTDARTGMELAGELADHLQAQLETANDKMSRPGGTNYRSPQQVPKEIMASILFYAIAMANHGWAGGKN